MFLGYMGEVTQKNGCGYYALELSDYPAPALISPTDENEYKNYFTSFQPINTISFNSIDFPSVLIVLNVGTKYCGIFLCGDDRFFIVCDFF